MKVDFTRRAQNQLRAAKAWWRDNRDKAPEAFDEEIARALSLLGINPVAGKLVPTRPGIRKLTIRRIHYDIYYRIGDDTVEVLAIWHTRRGARPPL